jgi:FkbM family methyltransferase
MIRQAIKSTIDKATNLFGFELLRSSKIPRHNALGLHAFGIRTVLDVGANSGQFARYIRSVLPESQIICFEPLPGPFRELEAWANRQNGHVLPLNAALGEREEIKEMFQHTDHSPSSSLLHATAVSHSYYPFTERESPVSVNVCPLDKILADRKVAIQSEVLIKLDVQGYEDRVIKGAPVTFASARACITEIDFDPLYDGQCTFREVWKLLDQLGYRYAGNFDQTYAKDGHVVFADAMFIK